LERLVPSDFEFLTFFNELGDSKYQIYQNKSMIKTGNENYKEINEYTSFYGSENISYLVRYPGQYKETYFKKFSGADIVL
jgi:hypothetical protein